MAIAYVYVVGFVGRPGEPLKIGYAGDPRRRLQYMQSGNPAGLELLFSLPFERRTARQVERRTHELLQARGVRGEWFAVTRSQAVAAIWKAATQVGARAASDPRQLPEASQPTRTMAQRLEAAARVYEMRAAGRSWRAVELAVGYCGGSAYKHARAYAEREGLPWPPAAE